MNTYKVGDKHFNRSDDAVKEAKKTGNIIKQVFQSYKLKALEDK